MKKLSFLVSTPNELMEVAKSILGQSQESRIFYVYGEMGSGKTTLIKYLCLALGVVDSVSSPTFSIVNEYRRGETKSSVFHFDLYRIKQNEELFDIGIEEYLNSSSICFVEWPERIEQLFDIRHSTIRLSVLPEGRAIEFLP